MSEKQESTISESLKFTGTIYRILKSQKNYFICENSIDRAISLIDFHVVINTIKRY